MKRKIHKNNENLIYDLNLITHKILGLKNFCSMLITWSWKMPWVS